MFERTDLEALAGYRGQNPVVSLYLNMPPHLRGTPEAYRARVKSLLRQANGRAPRSDVAVIERYFDREFDYSGRSIALFSSQGDGLWKVYRFAVPLRSYIHVGQKPFIMPLADLMDTYGSYTVALVDHQSMKLYHFHLGDLIAEYQVTGDEVRNLSAASGNRQAGIVRGQNPTSHKREIARSNWREFAAALDTFAKKHRASALLIGGTESNTAQFQETISAPWRDKLRGSLNLPMSAPEKEVRERSLEVLHAYQKRQQESLVESIRTAAAKASNGVVGLEDTIAALHAGRVQTLALIDGLNVPGYRCGNCGYLTVTKMETCPLCSHSMAQVQNAAEVAVREVVDQGGVVEFMEEESPLGKLGGMAALLRY